MIAKGTVDGPFLHRGYWEAIIGGHFVRGSLDVFVPPKGRTVTVYGPMVDGVIQAESIHLHGQEAPNEGHVASWSLAQKFEHFHRLNPHVFWHIKEIAWELRRTGHRCGSVKLIFERLRWLYALATLGDTDGFKLNNNHHAYYARVLMKLHPEFDGFFVLRKQRIPYDPDLVALGLVLAEDAAADD